MERKFVVMRVGAALFADPDATAWLDLPEPLNAALADGWTVVNHNSVFDMSGDLLVTFLVQRPGERPVVG